MVIRKKLPDKFYGNKPLRKSVGSYADACIIRHYDELTWIPYEMDFFYETTDGKRLELNDKKLMFCIKARPEKFTKYDFLWCTEVSALVVHQRVLEKLQQLCPADFQAFPVIITNLDLKDEPFENKDFYLINILNLLDIIDKEHPVRVRSRDGSRYYEKPSFRENSMEGHLLARDKNSNASVFFDPILAREFAKSKGVLFLSDVEVPI